MPPRHGGLPVVLGAFVCGCLGFGLVWTLGVGRTRVPDSSSAAPAVTEAATADGQGWEPRGRDHVEPRVTVPDDVAAPARPPVSDPAVAPASLEAPAAVQPDFGRPLSRFSSDRAPVGPAVDTVGRDPAPERGPPARLELPPEDEIVPAIAAPAAEAEPVAVETPLGDPEPLELRIAGDAEPARDTAAPESPVAAAPTGPPAHAPAVPAPLVEPDCAAPAPFAATPFAVAAPAPFVPPATLGPAVASPAKPPAAMPAANAADVPFASAPAVVPGGAPDRAAAPVAANTSGQGRPGPIQLEGVQSPQLTVEKRGPREVQVGKPARYEILVRNVGSATAHDVTLRDTVPFGTALVTTTPPAAPGRAAPGVPSDELVWSLGELAPGGQARAIVELMPQAEGEIGSVASVSFRADASVRSKATKPALAIQCSEPKPVLIGRDAGLTITVTNPGSGVATGVVLEGFLPEHVSHRSGSELEFDVGQLKPGESRTIELVLGTRGPGVHTARLEARADGGIEVEQAVRLEVTAPTLAIDVDMPLRRFLQRPATCAIAMVNAGTAPARSVELAAQLPPGMKFVRANNAGWHDERTHRVLWSLEELPPGETGNVEVVVMPVELGPQKIVAAARSVDGLAAQVAHVCDVEGLAALVFEVADSEDPIEVAGLTEYIVRVGNQGTKAATGVRLTATLLGDLEPVEARGPTGHRVENLSVAFEPLAKLAPSEEAVYRVRAKGRSAGDQRVQVQVTSEDHPAPITKEETTRVYADR
ncbi:MAG: hypothetical protein ACKOSQ_02580 [Planctomycetaceae bacterium]